MPMPTPRYCLRALSRLCAMLLLVAVVTVASRWSFQPACAAPQDGQNGAFLSGAARNAPILKEISQTLKTIDERLARLEKLATKLR